MRGQIPLSLGVSSGNRRCRFFNRVEDAQGLGCTLKTRRASSQPGGGASAARNSARYGRRQQSDLTPEHLNADGRIKIIAPAAAYQTPQAPSAHASIALPPISLPGRDSVRARHTGLLSPPGRSCLAGRSAFPQQRKTCRDAHAQHRQKNRKGPILRNTLANILLRNLRRFHRSPPALPALRHCIHKVRSPRAPPLSREPIPPAASPRALVPAPASAFFLGARLPPHVSQRHRPQPRCSIRLLPAPLRPPLTVPAHIDSRDICLTLYTCH